MSTKSHRNISVRSEVTPAPVRKQNRTETGGGVTPRRGDGMGSNVRES